MREVHPSVLLNAGDTEFKVLGRVGPFAVLYSISQQYVRVHRNDFVDHLTSIMIKNEPKDTRINANALHTEAQRQFYALLQLFET
jgi:hypothetical protein